MIRELLCNNDLTYRIVILEFLLPMGNSYVLLRYTKKIQASREPKTNKWFLISTSHFFTYLFKNVKLVTINIVKGKNGHYLSPDFVNDCDEKNLRVIYIFKSYIKFSFSFFSECTLCELNHSCITTVNS